MRMGSKDVEISVSSMDAGTSESELFEVERILSKSKAGVCIFALL